MASRVLFGRQSSGEQGFWVSKPGYNVYGAADDQLLISSSRRQAQILASGILYSPANGEYAVHFPNLGFLPHVLVSSARYLVTAILVSNTQANISVNQRLTFGTWAASNKPNPPDEVRWAVLNISG